MNVLRIAQASAEIGKLTSALGWLSEHRGSLTRSDKDAFSISVRIHTASVLPGAGEAQDKLSAIARLYIETIVEHAIKDCENTIEIHKSILREEAK